VTESQDGVYVLLKRDGRIIFIKGVEGDIYLFYAGVEKCLGGMLFHEVATGGQYGFHVVSVDDI